MASIGDKVSYVPDLCHADDLDAQGNYCYNWVKKVKIGKDVQEIPATKADVSRRDPRAGLVYPTTPTKMWPATITALSEDGLTASLDIQHPHGHKLGYTGRKFSEIPTPGTWSE